MLSINKTKIVGLTILAMLAVLLLGGEAKVDAQYVETVPNTRANAYMHPGIDIKPKVVNVNSSLVYATHAGFVTYMGEAPPSVAEYGWMVQIASDLNRDNVPDVITRYTHLRPNSIMVNDVHYKREFFDVDYFNRNQETIPFGNGSYVSRNQLIGIVGDSGSLGRPHIQYEIITSREKDLFAFDFNWDRWSSVHCNDDPYIEACSEDSKAPGLFFSINRKKPASVQAPVYLNPGVRSYSSPRTAELVSVRRAPQPDLPEPGLARPDFLGASIPLTPIPTGPAPTPIIANCHYEDAYNRRIEIDENGQLRIWVPECGGHFQVSGPNCDCGGWKGLPEINPCPDDPNEWCDSHGERYYGGPWCVNEGCNDLSEITIEFEGGYNDCPRDIVTVTCD